MYTYLNTCSKCGHDFESTVQQYKDSVCHVCCYNQQKEESMKQSIVWSLLDHGNGYFTPTAMVETDDGVEIMNYNLSYYGKDRARSVMSGISAFIKRIDHFNTEWHKA
jgi:hypothetical protein